MSHPVRALALLLAAVTSALGAVAVATAGAAPASPVRFTSSPVTAHEVVAPAPVAVASPAARVRVKVKAKVAAPVPPRATPHRVKAVTARPKAVTVVRTRALTPAQLMQRAIDRLPDVRPGDVEFILKPGLDSWGLAELHGTVWISPRVPARRMYDVVAHEWSHVLSAKAYDGDVNAAVDAMNDYFGGTGLTGAERAADCMARLLGATWTHYTSCSDSRWRAGAKRLLDRQKL